MNLTAADYRAMLTPASYYGQSGWWYFPQTSLGRYDAWYAITDKQDQIWVSPTADFSVLRYAAKINADGYLVVYDQYLNTQCGISAGGGMQGGGISSGGFAPKTTTTETVTYNGLPPLAPAQYFYLADRTNGTVYAFSISSNQWSFEPDTTGHSASTGISLVDLYDGSIKDMFILGGSIEFAQSATSTDFYQAIPMIDLVTGYPRALAVSAGNVTVI